MLNSISSSDYLHRQFNRLSFLTVYELRKINPLKVIIAHTNISSVRNKFEPLKEMIKDNVVILLVSETKLENTFLIGQFCVDGYSTPYRLDRTSHGGRTLLYIGEDILCKIIWKGFFANSTWGRK